MLRFKDIDLQVTHYRGVNPLNICREDGQSYWGVPWCSSTRTECANEFGKNKVDAKYGNSGCRKFEDYRHLFGVLLLWEAQILHYKFLCITHTFCGVTTTVSVKVTLLCVFQDFLFHLMNLWSFMKVLYTQLLPSSDWRLCFTRRYSSTV